MNFTVSADRILNIKFGSLHISCLVKSMWSPCIWSFWNGPRNLENRPEEFEIRRRIETAFTTALKIRKLKSILDIWADPLFLTLQQSMYDTHKNYNICRYVCEGVNNNYNKNNMGLWHTHGSPNIGQKARPNNNQQKKGLCKIIDLAVQADHRIKMKECENK